MSETDRDGRPRRPSASAAIRVVVHGAIVAHYVSGWVHGRLWPYMLTSDRADMNDLSRAWRDRCE